MHLLKHSTIIVLLTLAFTGQMRLISPISVLLSDATATRLPKGNSHLTGKPTLWQPIAERAGFSLPSFCKIIKRLYLQLNTSNIKDLESLVSLLFQHDFLLF